MERRSIDFPLDCTVRHDFRIVGKGSDIQVYVDGELAIDASGKFHATFDWDGERLKSISPSFENADRPTGEKKIYFRYEDRVPQVVWASDSAEARPAAPAPRRPGRNNRGWGTCVG